MRKLPKGLAELPAWFARTPAGQQAIAEAETTTAGERRLLAEQLPELAAELEATRKRLMPGLAKARQRLAAAERELEAAQIEVRQAEGELNSTEASLNSRMSEIRRQLRAGADTELIARCRREIMQIREGIASYAATRYAQLQEYERLRQRGELPPGAKPPTLDVAAFRQRIDRAQHVVGLALDKAEELHWAPEFDVSARFAVIREQLERDVGAILPEMAPTLPAA